MGHQLVDRVVSLRQEGQPILQVAVDAARSVWDDGKYGINSRGSHSAASRRLGYGVNGGHMPISKIRHINAARLSLSSSRRVRTVGRRKHREQPQLLRPTDLQPKRVPRFLDMAQSALVSEGTPNYVMRSLRRFGCR